MSLEEQRETSFLGEVLGASPVPDIQRLREQLRVAHQISDALARLEALRRILQEGSSKISELTPQLLDFLKDPDELVRTEILQALEGNSDPQVLVHLLGLAVADPDWLVRGWAMTCLSYADYPWLNQFLWQVYKRETSHFVKVRALGALVFRGVQEAVPLLTQYLDSSYHLLVINAAQELGAAISQLPSAVVEEVCRKLHERLEYWRARSAWGIVEALERSLQAMGGSSG